MASSKFLSASRKSDMVRFILQMKVVYDLKWYQLKSVEDLKIVEKDCFSFEPVKNPASLVLCFDDGRLR